MFYDKTYYLTVIFLIAFNSHCIAKLDIKEFLGNEPLTPRKIVEELLKYFQQEDPRGIPILKIPESIEIEGPVQASQIVLSDLSISGHSGISLEYVDVNLKQLQFQVRLNIPRLQIIGEYFWEGWWTNSEGEANVTFINLDVGVICEFGINHNGIIEALDLTAIIDPEIFLPHFTGLTQVHSAMVATADTLFNSIVLPVVQSRIRSQGLEAINKRLATIMKDKPYPVDLSPVDYLIAKVRSDIVRNRNLDPFTLHKVNEFEKTYFGTSIVLKSTELRGLSTLHRSENIRTELVDGRIYLTIEIGTQKLKGSTDWTIYTSLLPVGSGHAEIIIDGLRISLEAQQDLDVRHPPILRRIDIEIGNIALRSEGERYLDYFLEAAVNIVPNILRNKIMDNKVEGAVKKIIQERFNKVNLQHIIFDQLEKMEKEKRTK